MITTVCNSEISQVAFKVKGIVCTKCVTAIQQAMGDLKKKGFQEIPDKDVDIPSGLIKMNIDKKNTFTALEISNTLETMIQELAELTAQGTIGQDDENYYMTIDQSNEKIYISETKHNKKQENKIKAKLSELSKSSKQITISGPIHKHPDNSFAFNAPNEVTIE